MLYCDSSRILHNREAMMGYTDQLKHMFDKIQDEGRDLTEWEENFIESCIRQFKAKGELSEKQIAIVDRIYTNRTPTGTTFGEGGVTGRFSSESKTDRVRNEGR